MPAQTHSRRRMTAESRHAQILDITHAIVDTEGFHAATLNRIASEARVTRTVIYQQFGDLAGVFIALIEREGARARSQFAEAIAASEPERCGRGIRADFRQRAPGGGREPRHLATVPVPTRGRAP